MQKANPSLQPGRITPLWGRVGELYLYQIACIRSREHFCTYDRGSTRSYVFLLIRWQVRLDTVDRGRVGGVGGRSWHLLCHHCVAAVAHIVQNQYLANWSRSAPALPEEGVQITKTVVIVHSLIRVFPRIAVPIQHTPEPNAAAPALDVVLLVLALDLGHVVSLPPTHPSLAFVVALTPGPAHVNTPLAASPLTTSCSTTSSWR